MKRIVFLLLSLSLLLSVNACSSSDSLGGDASYPKSKEDERRERIGKIGGEKGLFSFGRDSDSDDAGAATGISVNSYLWRATLDTISFMPLLSADPFGGIIITDWYENPNARGERFKMTITITSKKLNSDSVKVTVFKQALRSDTWRDEVASLSVARDLENKILTRARQLRVEEK